MYLWILACTLLLWWVLHMPGCIQKQLIQFPARNTSRNLLIDRRETQQSLKGRKLGTDDVLSIVVLRSRKVDYLMESWGCTQYREVHFIKEFLVLVDWKSSVLCARLRLPRQVVFRSPSLLVIVMSVFWEPPKQVLQLVDSRPHNYIQVSSSHQKKLSLKKSSISWIFWS